MLKVLIVEDQKEKRNAVRRVIEEYTESHVSVAKTYFDAKRKLFLKHETYDLIIVDMFLADAKDKEDLRGLTGKDLILDMLNKEMRIPVLVATRYTKYCEEETNQDGNEIRTPGKRENPNYGNEVTEILLNGDCTYYEGLHRYLSHEVPFYLGIIFYDTQFPVWEEDLKYFLEKIDMEKYT